MNYARVQCDDIVNGAGLRVSLWVSGCRRHCKGCFNQAAQRFDYGEHFSFDGGGWKIVSRQLSEKHVDGLTILGGEPFEPENIPMINAICQVVRRDFPDKNIWIYTGNTFEELETMDKENPIVGQILRKIDVLVDGAFVEELRDLECRFRGSSNQRIVDVKKTLREGEVVLWNS